MSADAEGNLKTDRRDYEHLYDYLYGEIEEIDDRYLRFDKMLDFADRCRLFKDFDLGMWAYMAYNHVYDHAREKPEEDEYYIDRAARGVAAIYTFDNEQLWEYVSDFMSYHREWTRWQEEKKKKQE